MQRLLFILLAFSLLQSSKLNAQTGFIKLVDTAIVSYDTTYKMIGLGQNIDFIDFNYYYTYFIHDTFIDNSEMWLAKTTMDGKLLKLNKVLEPSATGHYSQYWVKGSVFKDSYFYDIINYFDTNIIAHQDYLIKYDTALNLIWKKRIYFNPLVDSNFNGVSKILLTKQGNLALSGWEGDTNHTDNLIMVYDTAGIKLNSYKYPLGSVINSIYKVESYNNYYLALYIQNIPNKAAFKAGFMKLNDSFQVLQNTLMSDSIFIGSPLTFKKFNESKFVYVGYTDSLHVLGYSKLVVVMLDTNFNVLWKRLYNLEECPVNNIFDCIVTSDKKIVFCGDNCIDSCHVNYGAGWISELDSNGNTLWDRRYHFRKNCQTSWFGLTEAENKNILAAGSISPPFIQPPVLPQNVWILKVDSNGHVSSTDSGFVNPCATPNAILEVGGDAKEIVNLYPNPAQNNIEILYNVYEQATVTIFDINGKQLFTTQLNSYEHNKEIDISSFAKGTYLLQVQSKTKQQTVKFVKE